ncbi:MAG: HAD family hydrolase [Nanoarchaeota archaeon]|nr:HAD family hydrolase [Nanoarchaeota archaeon]
MFIKKLEAVIFDLDGTLVHTKPEYRHEVVGSTLVELKRGYLKKDIDNLNKEIDDFWFGSEDARARIITEKWGLDPEGEFWPTFRKYDTIELRKEHTQPYPDVGILSELKDRGTKTGIVTSAPEHILNLEIGMLNHKFDAVLRAQLDLGFQKKPHQQALLRCFDLLGVSKDRGCYVGNSPEDMLMAKNTGTPGMLVLRGEYDYGEVESDLAIYSLQPLKLFT